jgi:hypothetical protein
LVPPSETSCHHLEFVMSIQNQSTTLAYAQLLVPSTTMPRHLHHREPESSYTKRLASEDPGPHTVKTVGILALQCNIIAVILSMLLEQIQSASAARLPSFLSTLQCLNNHQQMQLCAQWKI